MVRSPPIAGDIRVSTARQEHSAPLFARVVSNYAAVSRLANPPRDADAFSSTPERELQDRPGPKRSGLRCPAPGLARFRQLGREGGLGVTATLRTFAAIETAHGLCQAEGFQVELIRSVELALDVGVTGQDLQEGGRFYREFPSAMKESDRALRQKGRAAYSSAMPTRSPEHARCR